MYQTNLLALCVLGLPVVTLLTTTLFFHAPPPDGYCVDDVDRRLASYDWKYLVAAGCEGEFHDRPEFGPATSVLCARTYDPYAFPHYIQAVFELSDSGDPDAMCRYIDSGNSVTTVCTLDACPHAPELCEHDVDTNIFTCAHTCYCGRRGATAEYWDNDLANPYAYKREWPDAHLPTCEASWRDCITAQACTDAYALLFESTRALLENGTVTRLRSFAHPLAYDECATARDGRLPSLATHVYDHAGHYGMLALVDTMDALAGAMNVLIDAFDGLDARLRAVREQHRPA